MRDKIHIDEEIDEVNGTNEAQQNEMKCQYFRQLFATIKAELGQGQLGIVR